jgi:predicted Rossmann fold nucleotide-binding protein DprA/Smf involved in DNA uptake
LNVFTSSPIAFFCSQSCPGDVILRLQDWANARDAHSPPIVGGFHTPVERDVLRILLRGGAPVTIVLARAVTDWRPPAPLGTAIRDAIAAGFADIVSPFPETHRRTTSASAEARNRHILTLAATILIAHATPGGKTEELAREALVQNLTVFTLPSLHNANLVEIGGLIVPTYS